MYTRLIFFVFLLGVGGSKACQKRSLSLLESILIGSATGATEVITTGQPFRYFSNMKALRLPCSPHPVHWYKGCTVTLGSMVPITALQKVVRVYGEKMLQDRQEEPLSDLQKLAVASSSGGFSAFVATPCEAVPVYLQTLQNEKNISHSPIQAFRELKFVAWRGLLLVAPRNALYVASYGSLTKQVKKKLEPVVGQPHALTVLSGLAVGGVAATVTQPLAVLKTLLQADPFKKKYRTARDAAQSLYRKEGVRGFFRGLLLGRGPRVMFGVLIVAEAEEIYEKNYRELVLA